MSSRTISWSIKVMCMKKPHAGSRYVAHSAIRNASVGVITCPLQRKSNRKIYQEFKEEICLR